MAEIKRIPSRNEIPEKDKWAINDIYKDDEAWLDDLKKAKSFPEKIAQFRGKLSESAQALFDFMKLNEDMAVVLDSLANYAQRKSDEDTKVTKYQDFTGRIETLSVELGSVSSFAAPEICSIENDALEQFYKSLPDLELYRKHIYNIRKSKEHILSENEEKIISLAGEMSSAPENIFSMFNDADLEFPDVKDSDGNEHELTHGSYISLMHSSDRTLRKNAFEALYGVYGKYRNTSAAMLSSQVKTLMFRAKARKYESTLHASLDGSDVPVQVYHSLINAVHENMEYMYKYVRLRKKLMKLDDLHMYDLYVPIVNEAAVDISYEDAKKNIAESVKPLGEMYGKILKEGFENNWIDVYENKNKRSGAYSAGARVHPFVLLNYKDNIDSEFTLAHEMGHAIHSYLSNKNQPVVYSNYVIFVAEVASTCNESLLMQYLLRKTDDKIQRAYLINYFLEQFRTTLYRQAMFAEFELKINKIAESGEGLTADRLCEIYKELNQLYFGDDIVIDEEIALEWSRIPHFYYDYYVYQYATGYSAAIALSRKILSEGQPAVDKYLAFLSGGCSEDPITLLKNAGVDMTTSQPVSEALKLFDELIDEMEELLG